MKLFLIFLAGMMTGGTVGVCAMCLFFVAGESDRLNGTENYDNLE